ncbi:MAG: UV DNA damage repair endonuclease UvsE [Nitrososphaeraceae archaeon]
MKIGYPCINHSIGKKTVSTFRLSSYTEERLIKCIRYNLDTLHSILKYNVDHGLMFFRISSDLVPFASHPICTFNWKEYFKCEFNDIGKFIMNNNMRISMHPDQFVLINARNTNIIQNSIKELEYHAEILNLMNLDSSAKIQIHVGGIYGEKQISKKRFILNYNNLLSDNVKKRLVIENDDHLYNVKDCLEIHGDIQIPIILDTFHHECYADGINLIDAFKKVEHTWENSKDGVMMIDYSSQEQNQRKGKHSSTLDSQKFLKFILSTNFLDFDIMLEIKDKEKSAIKARNLVDQIKNDSVMPCK